MIRQALGKTLVGECSEVGDQSRWGVALVSLAWLGEHRLPLSDFGDMDHVRIFFVPHRVQIDEILRTSDR